MPHFIIFEISTALNNNFEADYSDIFDWTLHSKVMRSFVFGICMGYNGKVRTFFVHAENYTFVA